MESDAIRSENRGRKRGRGASKGLDPWKLVGRHVRKEFEGLGTFSGKIVRFKRGGLYRVDYEDGDCEDLEYEEVREILVDEAGGRGAADAGAAAGKEKLDRSAFGESVGVSKVSSDGDAGSDADSSSVSGKSESPPIGPLQLPHPRSGGIGVSEESVSFLFSVYNFLRSFSHQLFLSPFSLDDFVGALNHTSPSSLLDAIHVSILRALRRHLEDVSCDGSGSGGELASKCLRCLDWSLIDTLTWTVFVVEYLYMMGYTRGRNWAGFHDHVLNREYYSLSVHTKLRVLQILCDDLLEFAELRTEINMRESEEDGMNIDNDAMLTPENGPKRVHPRYSKTSACKDAETMENIVEPCESKQSHNGSSADSSKLIEPEANASDVVDDGNGDECKLCGMDGTLLCCDGCPYAYHPRCIGLTKASIPEGQWFCPECSVNKMGPVCSRIGKGLRGAEVFGIDPFERLFLGSCNYVLVLETSMNAEPICRCYSHNDVLELLRVLFSSAQHALLYSQICKGILRYYEISEDAIFLHSGGKKPEAKCLDGDTRTKLDINPLDGKEQAACTAFPTKENHIPLDTIEQENCLSNASGSNVENGEASLCRENENNEAGVTGSTQDLCKGGLEIQQKDVQFAPGYTEMTAQQLGTESSISVGSQILPADPSDFNHHSSGERSNVLELATCASRDADGAGREDAGSVVLCTKNSIVSTSLETRLDHCSDGSKGDIIGCSSYMGTSFRPQGYINQYILGDIAASAAANLAVLTSENSQASESQSSNPRKVTSGNITMQIKAFTGAALHFQWPSSEKKLMDVPRERCGWCIACKLAETNRKGCLLNSVAFNALRGDPKVIGGVRLIKNREGPVPAIAAFILNMEESLHGLIVGPLSSFGYRRQWRKQLEQASTCNSLQYLLLDLEENIHSLAFSGSWVKPVDDWSFKFATAQFGACNVGSAQKRGPSTRRNRKQSATSEIIADANWKTFHWWRGGKLSRLVFQTGILPRTMVKKVARQGGYKKISGIHYVEGSEIPRRSRRFAWRAAVERSKNASQLALQVRCLDAHIRWNDIVRPELNSLDGKGLDVETSAFRNAFVCDKKIVERKIWYALAFRNQKHLPSRVMKNVIEVEQSPYGKERYWFSESHVPLYLIKDYEGKAEKVPYPLLKTSHLLSKITRRQLKTSRGDILSYLVHRDDMSSCALCQQAVLLRNAVKCNACQGYCHKDCTVPLTAELINQFEFLHICKQCHRTQSAIRNQNFGSPKVQLSLEGQQGMIHLGNVEAPSKKKPSSSNRGSVSRKGTSLTLGLIWRKKNSKLDLGTDFRLKNILLRGASGMDPSMRPECGLCMEPYNSNLMYIRCEHCSVWYHADAVQLKEEDIFKLEGFKCCKCRRKISPMCPYMSEERKLCMKTTKKQVGMERNQTGMLCAAPGYVFELAESTSPVLHSETQDVLTEEYDPLLFSLENVELITEQMPEMSPTLDTAPVLYPNPQKLPVRRYVKLENDSEGFSAYPSDEDPQNLRSNLESIKEEALPPQAEWDFPMGDELAAFQGGEDVEFEPQTYFSFTELLATGDDRMNERSDILDGLYDAQPVDDVPGCWGNSSGCSMDVDQAMPSYNSFNSAGCNMDVGQDNLCETYMDMVDSMKVEPLADPVPCGMCSRIEPDPDLSCEICDLQIHSHCSPWVELPSSDHRWRCGRCREWR